MNKQSYIIRSSDRVRDIMAAAYNVARQMIDIGPVEVIVQSFDDSRSSAQNRLLWASLSDISRKLKWFVESSPGVYSEEYLDSDEWKDILSAALTKHQKVARGIDGGFVLLGRRTSKMKKKEFADLLTITLAFGDQHGVIWSEPVPAEYLEWSNG